MIKTIPMFYEIRDRSGDLRGCLLGTLHDLSQIGLDFSDVPDIFSSSSKVQKCFERASVFAMESSHEHKDMHRDDYINSMKWLINMGFSSIDMAMELDAIEQGKQVVSLETLEEVKRWKSLEDSLDRAEDQHFRQLSKEDLTDCANMINSGEDFISGSEQLTARLLLKCRSKEGTDISTQRTKNMAEKAAQLMKDKNIHFLAVGMSHLPNIGQSLGMCELLRQKGYTVERVFEG